ncbi:MAG: hypothetical protein ABIS59_02815 [Candidatus Saccharibacteria bacterium]
MIYPMDDPNPPILQRLLVKLGFNSLVEPNAEARVAIEKWLQTNTPGTVLKLQLIKRGFEFDD